MSAVKIAGPLRPSAALMVRAGLLIGGALTVIAALAMWVASRVGGSASAPVIGPVGRAALVAAPLVVAVVVGGLTARTRVSYADGLLRLRSWRGEVGFRPARALNWRRVTPRGQVVGQTLVMCADDGRVVLFTEPFWPLEWPRQVAAAAGLRVEDLGPLTVGRLGAALPGNRWPFWIRHPKLTPLLSILLVAGYLAVVVGVSMRG